ncbi:prolyl oligopeptidase family serine peptidase [Kaistella palustris]|uniref:prolyl oligopeptidase family serine peptidase n=1 Tax=Kaistella palustris TaxID=493376 RepID=UPI0003FB088C|nr:prolyl oligopeptidase family serine peptidase [Kaistella palustris]
MKKRIILALLAFNSAFAGAQWKYPATPKIAVDENLWGTNYQDNYRWLENMSDPKVIAWFRQQADLTNSVMSQISGRDELIQEWRKLALLQPAVVFAIAEANGKYFFQKRMPGEKVSKVYYRDRIDGPDQLLFDPLTFIPGETLTVESITPSNDGSKLLISYSEGGAEVSTLRVLDVKSKKFLNDIIKDTAGAGDWTFDDSAFFYTWIKSADNTDPTARLSPKTKLHKLGTPLNADVDFFSNASYPNLKIDPKVYAFSFLSKDEKKYVFAGESSVQRELVSYYAPIDQFNSKSIPWKKLTTANDQIVRGLEMFGDRVYGITYKNAKNYQLVATDLRNPDWAHAEVIAPNREMTLESLSRSKDYLILTYSDGLHNFLYKLDPKTKNLTPVKLPYEGTAVVQRLALDSNEFIIGMTSWNKPFTEMLYNAETGEFTKSPFNEPANYPDEYKNLVVEEVNVKGHDGAMIPLSIIYKKGIKKDGSNVGFIEGYGAYGISMTPGFATRLYSLAVKGVVIAVAHVRGGSEKGEEWYKAGYKTTKPNTWKDFISCAEYLISNGYTKADRLGGTGTSAGGILISRSITERPDLFAAAVCNVGLGNAMRAEFSSNGPVNTPEFGTVKDSIETKALYEMDGMMHVKDGVKYPAVIGVGGWNDPRVVPWQPGKFIAALQNASISGKPVLLKINYDNGHFTEDKEVTYANFADQYAFLMWQCGHPDFQKKKN